MNKEDIIRMARDCGINFHQAGWPELERFAALVAAAEREVCAKVADAEAARWEKNSDGQVSVQGIATAIRARNHP